MPQLSLYLDEPTMEMLREKSSRAHQSMSRYVTGLIRESGEGRGWDNVYGCLKDPSFVVPEEEGDLDEIVLFA